MNKLYFGDNLEVLKGIESNSVDLVYLDPPFNSKETYNVLYKSPVGGDAQVRAFDDTWSWEDGASKALAALSVEDLNTFNVLHSLQRFLGTSDIMAYLAMMAVRLVELRRVLKPDGSMYLHCDPTACHYLKVLLDAVFGGAGFVNHITWKRSHAHSDGAQGSRHYGRISDTILFHARSAGRTWNVQYTPYSSEYVERDYRRVDDDDRIARAHGKERSGRVIHELVVAALNGSLPRREDDGRMVIFGEGMEPDRIVAYRPARSDWRSHRDIPLIELASLVLPLMRKGRTVDEMLAHFGKTFNLSRLRKPTRKRFEAAIAMAQTVAAE